MLCGMPCDDADTPRRPRNRRMMGAAAAGDHYHHPLLPQLPLGLAFDNLHSHQHHLDGAELDFQSPPLPNLMWVSASTHPQGFGWPAHAPTVLAVVPAHILPQSPSGSRLRPHGAAAATAEANGGLATSRHPHFPQTARAILLNSKTATNSTMHSQRQLREHEGRRRRHRVHEPPATAPTTQRGPPAGDQHGQPHAPTARGSSPVQLSCRTQDHQQFGTTAACPSEDASGPSAVSALSPLPPPFLQATAERPFRNPDSTHGEHDGDGGSGSVVVAAIPPGGNAYGNRDGDDDAVRRQQPGSVALPTNPTWARGGAGHGPAEALSRRRREKRIFGENSEITSRTPRAATTSAFPPLRQAQSAAAPTTLRARRRISASAMHQRPTEEACPIEVKRHTARGRSVRPSRHAARHPVVSAEARSGSNRKDTVLRELAANHRSDDSSHLHDDHLNRNPQLHQQHPQLHQQHPQLHQQHPQLHQQQHQQHHQLHQQHQQHQQQHHQLHQQRQHQQQQHHQLHQQRQHQQQQHHQLHQQQQSLHFSHLAPQQQGQPPPASEYRATRNFSTRATANHLSPAACSETPAIPRAATAIPRTARAIPRAATAIPRAATETHNVVSHLSSANCLPPVASTQPIIRNFTAMSGLAQHPPRSPTSASGNDQSRQNIPVPRPITPLPRMPSLSGVNYGGTRLRPPPNRLTLLPANQTRQSQEEVWQHLPQVLPQSPGQMTPLRQATPLRHPMQLVTPPRAPTPVSENAGRQAPPFMHQTPQMGMSGGGAPIGATGNDAVGSSGMKGPQGDGSYVIETRIRDSRIVESENMGGESNCQDMPDRVVQVPVVHEILKYLPRKEVREVVVHKPTTSVQYVDRVVEVPEIVFVDKVEEVEEIVEVVRRVPVKVQVDVPRRESTNVQNREPPVFREQQASSRTPSIIKPRFIEKEVPTVVSQRVIPIVVANSTVDEVEVVVDILEPVLVPLKVFVPVPCELDLVGGQVCDSRVQFADVDVAKYASLWNELNGPECPIPPEAILRRVREKSQLDQPRGGASAGSTADVSTEQTSPQDSSTASCAPSVTAANTTWSYPLHLMGQSEVKKMAAVSSIPPSSASSFAGGGRGQTAFSVVPSTTVGTRTSSAGRRGSSPGVSLMSSSKNVISSPLQAAVW